MRPQIDVQLKATSSPNILGDGLHYQLRAKNYHDLRATPRLTPFILMVLEMPDAERQWLVWSDDQLTIRRRIWWTTISGHPPIDADSQVVTIPETQLLDPATLQDLMARARTGRLTGGAL